MQEKHDPSVNYLEALLAGDSQGLLAGFAGEPAIDDPLGGRVRDIADFGRFFQERHAWLVERTAHIEPLRTTHTNQRTVFECLLHLRLPEKVVVLPVAVVGEHAAPGQVSAIRVYHSLWPLQAAHRVRPPLLPHDASLSVADVVATYQHALAAGDVAAIVSTFEPNGSFREPAGGDYIFRGRDKLYEFMAHLLGSGGIGLEHCTVTDDGVACAIEFNAVHFGPHRLEPQAGIAVYERGHSGQLCAARIYDDVNVEAFAVASGPAIVQSAQ